MEFYSVKKRGYVQVPEEECTKARLSRKGGVTYAVRAVTQYGNLTKFMTKDGWEALKCREE